MCSARSGISSGRSSAITSRIYFPRRESTLALCGGRFVHNIDAVEYRSDSLRAKTHNRRRALAAFAALLSFLMAGAAHAHPAHKGGFFLPTGDKAKIVTITATGEATAGITVMTEAIAEKETGPKDTVEKFGELYAFSPEFIAVHRDEPTKTSSGICNLTTNTISPCSMATSMS